MPPVRHVVFLNDDGQPPLQVALPEPGAQREVVVSGEEIVVAREGLVAFEEANAPAPRTATAKVVVLPAQVGAAQALRHMRPSRALRAASRAQRARPVRRRRSTTITTTSSRRSRLARRRAASRPPRKRPVRRIRMRPTTE